MSSEMHFSVILPTVRRDSLEAAIESVLAQDYKDFSLFVVLDGFPKISKHDPLCEKYAPEGVTFIRTPVVHEDSGAYARNCGVKASSKYKPGGWIAYIDDDDIWYPNHLTILSSLAKLVPTATMLRTAGQEFKLKHKHPRSSERVVKLGPVNTDDPLTVGMAHARELFEKTDGWRAEDNHDHLLWTELERAGGIPAVSTDVTFRFKR
jgi:glycosyltransferase involved in cell wall biosynthesis